MASSLDLSLPEPPRQRGRGGLVQWLTFLGVLAVLAALGFGLPRGGGRPARGLAKSPEEALRLKSLATDLEKRTLYVQAEQVWAEYMESSELTPEERAEVLYRRGKCLAEGGRHAEAARRLSEVEGFPVPREEKRKARQLLLECLAAHGKQDVRDSVARAFAIGEEEKGTVVARVGSDGITKEEVRADLVSSLERMLKLQGAPMTPAELAAKAAELADQELKEPERAKAALMRAVSQRVLYREGLERGFADDPDTHGAVARFRRELIANRVVEAEVEGAMKALGPTELKNHYEAHVERFTEKPGVEFSYAPFPGAAEAEGAIAKLKDPGTAAEVKLKRASGAAVPGEPVPDLGPSAEVAAHVLALAEGEVSSRPIEHAAAFYVFRAEKKRPERQLAFEEAEPRVRADLAAAKREEALQGLQALLSEKFRVELLDPAAAGKEELPGPGAGTESGAEAKAKEETKAGAAPKP
ncbi:MAG: peptidyl-prolyl cis-trans isomerase [Planctomycetes bacterium]|nr:peptidyl-prolyl cis-trans isomerase [Planctomycetota bacterium]